MSRLDPVFDDRAPGICSEQLASVVFSCSCRSISYSPVLSRT